MTDLTNKENQQPPIEFTPSPEDEILLLQNIWHTHAKDKQTLSAMYWAENCIYSNTYSESFKKEAALIIVTLGITLLRNKPNIGYAGIVDSLRKAFAYLPISSISQDAIKAGSEWSEVYGEVKAEAEIMRQLLKLSDFLEEVTSNPKLAALSANLLSILSTDFKDERASLLQTIESGSDQDAIIAYEQYWQEYVETQPNEAIVVASRFATRMLKDINIRQFYLVFKQIKNLAATSYSPNLIELFNKELVKSLGANISRLTVIKMAQFRVMIGDQDLSYLASMLTSGSMKYLGTSEGDAYDLQSQERPVEKLVFQGD